MTTDEAMEYIESQEWGHKRSDNDTAYHTSFTYDLALHLSGDFPDEETKQKILFAIIGKLNAKQR